MSARRDYKEHLAREQASLSLMGQGAALRLVERAGEAEPEGTPPPS